MLGRIEFLANIIYKLDDTAHIIYKYVEWKTLRKDLLAGIAEQKSLPTLQTELLSFKQRSNQSVSELEEEPYVLQSTLSKGNQSNYNSTYF